MEASQQQPASGFAYCSWHQGYSDTCRLVRAVEQGSGAGGHLFACADCRNTYRLLPLADQP